MAQPTICFSAIGLNHGHIYGQVNLLLRAGAEFVSFYAQEPELVARFAQTYPQARLAHSAQEILEDETVHPRWINSFFSPPPARPRWWRPRWPITSIPNTRSWRTLEN